MPKTLRGSMEATGVARQWTVPRPFEFIVNLSRIPTGLSDPNRPWLLAPDSKGLSQPPYPGLLRMVEDVLKQANPPVLAKPCVCFNLSGLIECPGMGLDPDLQDDLKPSLSRIVEQVLA